MKNLDTTFIADWAIIKTKEKPVKPNEKYLTATEKYNKIVEHEVRTNYNIPYFF